MVFVQVMYRGEAPFHAHRLKKLSWRLLLDEQSAQVSYAAESDGQSDAAPAGAIGCETGGDS